MLHLSVRFISFIKRVLYHSEALFVVCVTLLADILQISDEVARRLWKQYIPFS